MYEKKKRQTSQNKLCSYYTIKLRERVGILNVTNEEEKRRRKGRQNNESRVSLEHELFKNNQSTSKESEKMSLATELLRQMEKQRRRRGGVRSAFGM